MHELSIASSILDAVRTESERHSGAHVHKVGVRVGALCGVEPEALRFGFEALVQGTELDPLVLEIVSVPRRQRCPACDFAFEVSEDELACPRCGNEETCLAGGEELDFAYMEVEE